MPFEQLENAMRSGLADNINAKGVVLVRGRKVLLALRHVPVELSKLTPCSWILRTDAEIQPVMVSQVMRDLVSLLEMPKSGLVGQNSI